MKIKRINALNSNNEEELNSEGLDELLKRSWTEAEQNNAFKYKFSESVRKRRLNGVYKFHCYLNLNRVTMKRKAQTANKVRVASNKEQFNFTKINKKEILFDFIIEGIQNTINEQSDNKIKGTIIVNNAPFEFCSSLLVVELEKCLPQIYCKESLILALYVISVSKNENMRLGFNSVGANSSVNHMHWHVYYQNDLLIAKLPVNDGQLSDWYLKSMVFELDSNSTDKHKIYLQLAINIEKLLDYIIDHLNLAYNLFLTKCSTNTNIIRLFVWPRLPCFDSRNNFEILPAICEFSGFFNLKDEEMFNQIDEKDLVHISKQYEIDQSLFDEIIKKRNEIFK